MKFYLVSQGLGDVVASFARVHPWMSYLLKIVTAGLAVGLPALLLVIK